MQLIQDGLKQGKWMISDVTKQSTKSVLRNLIVSTYIILRSHYRVRQHTQVYKCILLEIFLSSLFPLFCRDFMLYYSIRTYLRILVSNTISISDDFLVVFPVTRRMPPVARELVTLSKHLSSPLFFYGVRVAQWLVSCVVFCRSLFVFLSFFFLPLYCLIYDFCLTLWYLQTFLMSFLLLFEKNLFSKNIRQI